MDDKTPDQDPEDHGNILDIEEPDDFVAESLAEAEAEKAAASPEKKEAGAAVKPSEAVSRAKAEYGLDDEDLAGLDDAGIAKLVRSIDRTISKQGRGQVAPPPPVKAEAAPAAPAQRKKLEIQLNKEVWDPELVTALEAIQQHYDSEVGELRGQLDALMEHESKKAGAAFAERFDGWVEELGDGYEADFGKGRGHALGGDSKEYKARLAIVEEMDGLAAGYEKTGRKVPGEKELFARAVRILHGEKAEAKAKAKVETNISKALKERSKQTISRASGSPRDDEPEGEHKARRNLAHRMAAMGMLGDNDEDGGF